MDNYSILFLPFKREVRVTGRTNLLTACLQAGIIVDNVCGGDGICGRCKMIIKQGEVDTELLPLLKREEVQLGYVLGCQTYPKSDLVVEIPRETFAIEKAIADKAAERFRAKEPGKRTFEKFPLRPLTSRVKLDVPRPSLEDTRADKERIKYVLKKQTSIEKMQTGLKIVRRIPEVLRQSNYRIVATVGMRRDIAEIMDIEPYEGRISNYIAVVDIGTTTVVLHLIDAVNGQTIDAEACFNSQSVYGRDVISRIIASEAGNKEHLQEAIVRDINNLISIVSERSKINVSDITALVCAGNTVMMHLFFGLDASGIRRKPFIAVATDLPPFRAAELGIKINARGLVYMIPCIGSWVGGDVTAGILAVNLYESDKIVMLVDIGTNGEIVVGCRDFIVATSASTGPALEGASVCCGMMAEPGAIEKVDLVNGELKIEVIGESIPRGICGSGIIDTIACLFKAGIIDRRGIMNRESERVAVLENGIPRYILYRKEEGSHTYEIYISEADINNIIVAKAAVFAAIRLILKRLDLDILEVDKIYVGGGFGSRINIENAITIGLLPDIMRHKIIYAGNTSIKGASIVALSQYAFEKAREISSKTTYFDLLGAEDYVEEFQRALFIPHTDVSLFPSVS